MAKFFLPPIVALCLAGANTAAARAKLAPAYGSSLAASYRAHIEALAQSFQGGGDAIDA